LDEFFSIKNGKLGEKKILLNSTDNIFSEIRNLNQMYVGHVLKKFAAQIEEEIEERKNLKTVQQIKEFAKKLKRLQDDKQNLEVHIGLLQQVNVHLQGKNFKTAVQMQQSMLLGDNPQEILDYIENCINSQDAYLKVIRLMCLFCLTIGITKSKYEFLKNEILQTYGYDKLIDLRDLEDCGLLGVLKTNWNLIKSQLDLLHPDMDIQNSMYDVHSVFSGFCPITIALIEAATGKGGWESIKKTMNLLPGKSLEFQQNSICEKNTILVYFMGGITMSEMNAIRYLNKKYQNIREYVVVTTKLISGDTFLGNIFQDLNLKIIKKEPVVLNTDPVETLE
jgi:vacuolar protein sorting-associated protein 33A